MSIYDIADRWEANPLATENSHEGRMTFQTRVLRYMQNGRLEHARQKLLWRYPARKMKDGGESNLFGKLGEHVWADFLVSQGHELTESPREGYFPDYDL